MFEYIEKFKTMTVGLFVHYGLYSVLGKGEWYLSTGKISAERYENLQTKFRVNKNWAREIVRAAKEMGAKYITITARHHDGFSLYDTCGLSEYDALHAACGRDLIAEFVSACREGGIAPFFYHTLLDWREPTYQSNFSEYIDYLAQSIEILCKNYGTISGFWFDGMWDKTDADWQEDRLYGIIRKYQPEAMIINNTGLNALGQVGHEEIDSVTFERGKPCYVDCSKKPLAGEMCQILNDHWGYAKEDVNYKSVNVLVEDLIDCKASGCNYLLNTGLKGNGKVNAMDRCLLQELGIWIKKNREFVYESRSCGDDNATLFKSKKGYYVAIKNVPMSANQNVTLRDGKTRRNVVEPRIKIKRAEWLDNGEKIIIKDDYKFDAVPFEYGTSLCARIAKIETEN